MDNAFLIGADPELFIKNIYTNENVSAHDLIPGTKYEPYFVDGGAIQVDGTAAEFNINPSASKAEFLGNMSKVLDNLYDRIEGQFDTVLKIDFSPTAIYEPNYFDSLPPEIKVLGCEPDFNAYTGEQNLPPSTTEPFRTAGGHVHCGWGHGFDIYDPEYLETCRDLVKQLDVLLYSASLCWDNDKKRRELYGAKGAFRPKPYGLEYRSLSNKWVETQERQEYVYDTTIRAMDLLFNKKIKLF